MRITASSLSFFSIFFCNFVPDYKRNNNKK